MRFDIVIEGALVLDGTGAEGRAADVGVTGELITAVTPPGGLAGAEAVERIDAGGHVLSPGFIDLHSHTDFTVQGTPGADASVAQGVTTLLTGNCGFSPFPVRDLESAKRTAAFFNDGLAWDWDDLAGYAASVEASGPAINLALQVGHGALRTAVIGPGERGAEAEDVEAMRGLLATAAEQGAYGMSTGLIYAPGSYSNAAEVTSLAAEAAAHGLLYSTHMRSESEHLIEAVGEAIATARASGVRLEISHLKAMGRRNHGKVGEALKMIEAARADGVDVAADVYPYTASSTTLTSRLPGWALDGGVGALLERLGDKETREAIAENLRARMAADIDSAGVVIADLPLGRFTEDVGRSLDEIAGDLGIDPAEAVCEILAAHGGAVSIVNNAMAGADVDEVLAHPLVSVASDGQVLRATGPGRPHPRSFGTFVRVLGHYVRERGLLTLPEAVRKMTGLPAERLGLTGRGRIAEGMVADLAVFDPDTVAERATFTDPWRLATGVRDVFVAGKAVRRDGEATGERPGRVLRKGQ
ncbi:N-acyl-D-amino-acid deacylase family protein [Phytomonospora endophytica]|uniref:N-acyl-D-amino-acid deacylase n=1 Tax=Phytomonospora endophytica TaxID=714109 RepID=A0A841FLH6_9ACTN|nr:D-aminoacylase [Phytomonospora endophytica]MBB6033469.1 N-acyl-D-amino-acid deacylase [Phytomonospora endophytica]GIG65012.1 N-acyl-D-amino-acid deacylase [Phytomonospora endophytica]